MSRWQSPSASAAGVLAAGVLRWGAASATPASLSGVQAKAAAAITLRVNDLNAAIAKVAAAKDLGSGAAILTAYLQNDIAPLQALGQKIAADMTEAAEADAATIFTNFRVLALVLPAAWPTWPADQRRRSSTDQIANLTACLCQGGQRRVNSGQPGRPSHATHRRPEQRRSAVPPPARPASVTASLPCVLGYTPAQWNANHALLSTERSADQAARNDIKQARSDLRQIWKRPQVRRQPRRTPPRTRTPRTTTSA